MMSGEPLLPNEKAVSVKKWKKLSSICCFVCLLLCVMGFLIVTRGHGTLATMTLYATNKGFACHKYPKLCQAPMNCQDYGPAEVFRENFESISKNGHGNPQAWCFAPNYEHYVWECYNGDKVKAAWLIYNITRDYGADALDFDASMCFILGCKTQAEVTPDTTPEEGEQICNRIYGHKKWAKLKFAEWQSHTAAYNALGESHRKESAVYFRLGNCAQGSYQCDAMYCKETFCKDPHWIAKWGHLDPTLSY